MAGKVYKEPIQVIQIGTQSDTQFGQVSSGTNTVLYDCLATITEKSLSPETNEIQDFSFSQTVSFYLDPEKPINYGNIVTWRSKELSIKGIEYNDTKTFVTLKTVSR